ncbi:MAG TPA: tRNA dihydrouridine(20/20a) synthase DusA [Dongiaceae bacterium]|nr:tRNA dihydrouridine(20/20a) synthase DusA [Dongiaceae bacterium]
MSNTLSRRFCIAPMLEWTDRHCRTFHRMLTQHSLLYTEMVTTAALINGHREQHLRFNPSEHPVALQLGGSDPAALAECTRMAADYGYDEVNLNVGCPSDRVQSGRFGACLMAEPDLVARCVEAMQAAASIPVTVKCRIGIDDQDDYNDLQRFVDTVASAGIRTFIIHARKAWLDGLSPKENRDIPPLNYERVYLLKQEFSQLEIVINGGVQTLDDCRVHLEKVDGVMMGRAAYHNPLQLRDVDRLLFNDPTEKPSDRELLEQICHYIEQELAQGGKLKYISRHIIGLFQNRPGARQWRRHISENAHRDNAGVDVIRQAASLIPDLL